MKNDMLYDALGQHADIFFMLILFFLVIVLRIYLSCIPSYHRWIAIVPIVNSWIFLLIILFFCYSAGVVGMTILCIAIFLKSIHEITRLWIKHPKYPNKINRFFIKDGLLLIAVIIFSLSLYFLSKILFEKNQASILLFILFCIQFSDVCQYIMGKLAGHKFFNQKLAPSVSPNKTIEGAILGVLLMSILAIFLAQILTPFSPIQSFWLAMLLGVLGIMGDLFQSLIKRKHQIKDMGFWLKGHGGVLDRIDSLLFAVPCFFMVYLFLF